MPTRRFLAPQARAGTGHGYLTQPARQYPLVADPPDVAARIGEARAMCDEPESPSPAWVHAQSELAAEHDRLRRLHQIQLDRVNRASLALEYRIADCQRRAKDQHANISTDLYLIDKMSQRGNRANVESRIARLEARLDGVEP